MEVQKNTFSLDSCWESLSQNTSIDILYQDRLPQSRLVSSNTGLEQSFDDELEAKAASTTLFDFPITQNVYSGENSAEYDFQNASYPPNTDNEGNSQRISHNNQIQNEYLKEPYQTVNPVRLRDGLSPRLSI
jgi:hypothetical protein